MAQSRILEWNSKDNVVLLLTCQEEQEWIEMLQNPEMMKEWIESKQKESNLKSKKDDEPCRMCK